MTLSKSKRQLADLLIAAGVKQFPDGANWVAQGSSDMKASFYEGEARPKCARGETVFCGDYCGTTHDVQLPALIPNWHQTVLSRYEFNSIVEERVDIDVDQYCESVKPSIPDQPTLDQLLRDWRNAADHAARKQGEADEAAALRDQRWQAVQERVVLFGVNVTSVRCDD